MAWITPQKVHGILKRYMLVDGFDMVFDLKKSRGTYIYDAKSGRMLLDFFTCFASSPIGYNHPKMIEIKDKLAYTAVNKPTNSDVYTCELAEFVDTFSRIAMPGEFKHMFLISGGALAVENALKVAFDWKVRKNFKKGYVNERGHKVIHFREAFHGRTGYTLSLTNTHDLRKIKYFPKFDWPRIDNPKIEFPLNGENLEKVKKAEKKSIKQIYRAIDDNPDDIAAIIIEPIQGEGGDNHFRNEFFVELRRIADEHEIMLIMDEVQTGVGLTGKMWAYQHFDFVPDIIAFGKKTQVCGIICNNRVEAIDNNVFQESNRLNSTWGGNLVDMVRFSRYLEIIDEENLVENARVQGEYLLEKLNCMGGELNGKIKNIRGRGLMAAFDVSSSEERDKIRSKIYENGVAILGCGQKTIRFRPPLNINRNEIDEGLEIISKTLREFYH